jgi:hypothetical protein
MTGNASESRKPRPRAQQRKQPLPRPRSDSNTPQREADCRQGETGRRLQARGNWQASTARTGFALSLKNYSIMKQPLSHGTGLGNNSQTRNASFEHWPPPAACRQCIHSALHTHVPCCQLQLHQWRGMLQHVRPLRTAVRSGVREINSALQAIKNVQLVQRKTRTLPAEACARELYAAVTHP